MFILPFLTESLDTTGMRALEIGSGDGAYSAVLSQAFQEYSGLEVRTDAVRRADQFCRRFGARNTCFFHDEAGNLANFLSSVKEKFHMIILHAVIEHLLPHERLSLLQTCWDYLDDDGYLFIGEAPNNIFHADWHSSYMTYFQQMPIEMWPYFYDKSRNARWRQVIRQSIRDDKLIVRAFRQGVAVGFRELETGLRLPDIATLRSHTVANNYHVLLMNRFPYLRFDFLNLCEIRQIGRTSREQPRGSPPLDLPDIFSRHYLEVLLQKRSLTAPPGDWVVIALSDVGAALASSDAVAEGKIIRPQSPLTVELPSGLALKDDAIDVMLQVMRPSDGGVLRCETQAGVKVFERFLWRAMREISAWRDRMVFQLPPLSPSDFPLRVVSERRNIRLGYLFLRRRSSADVGATSLPG
jgi:hypothetical protein